MPIKKIKKKTKPKVVKPKNKKPKQTKPKPAPQIQIITQKLPRTKCCTDPVKSGQSYTIPLGYTDRLGTMRIGEKPVENIPIPIQRPIPIQMPVNEVITITEQQPVVKEVTLKKKTKKPKKQLIIEDDEEPQNIIIPPLAVAKEEKKPRRNSIEDLKIRYEMVTGNPFTRTNVKKSELKQEVQDLEQRRESNIKDYTKN
jgi:hypothetical protein